MTFRGPLSGSVYALFVDHNINGRVLVPGAAFLEAVGAVSSVGVGSELRRTFFFSPLSLSEAGAEGAAWIECALLERMPSTIDETPSPWASDTPFEVRRPQQYLQAIHSRSGCVSGLTPAAFYRCLAGAGLSYGMSVHVADLDGAMQASALIARGQGTDTKLPFAIEVARLCGRSAGHLLATVTSAEGSDSDIDLGGTRSETCTQLIGFQVRALRPASAYKEPKHLYIADWIDAPKQRQGLVDMAVLFREAHCKTTHLQAQERGRVVLPHALLMSTSTTAPLAALAASRQLMLAANSDKSSEPPLWLLSDEPELACSGKAVRVPRLATAASLQAGGQPRLHGAQLLTGGTGGLGIVTAQWLAGCGASALLLASRSGAVADGVAALELRASGADVRVALCDAADAASTGRLLAA
uniref:Ketoreductase (KR) domain-containing protein n=2 Tax=Emiliania huxleyi TaxID=2903 RepID=A0A0D3IZU7_EMIH1